MGWGRFFLLGDWGQQMDLTDAKREIAELRERINSQQSMGAVRQDLPQNNRLMQLEYENSRLRRSLELTIGMLASKGIISEREMQDLKGG